MNRPDNKQKIFESDYPVIIELLKIETMGDIAKRYTVSRQRIKQILDALGVPVKDRQLVFVCSTPLCKNTIKRKWPLRRDTIFCIGCTEFRRKYPGGVGLKRRVIQKGYICERCHKNPPLSKGVCASCQQAEHLRKCAKCKARNRAQQLIYYADNRDRLVIYSRMMYSMRRDLRIHEYLTSYYRGL